MKSRFSTVDIAVVIKELKRFYGMRVVNVYDVDSKTYLIKLGKPDDKAVILIESGIRIHGTEYDWPKNMAPSGFSMKLRKHIKGRRLESINQLGMDRIVDLQFGSGEAAYHVILELYDRGNVVLTDFEFTILNILRPRTDTCQDVKFVVREKYPVNAAKQHSIPSDEKLMEVILAAKVGEVLKKVLLPHLDYGPAMTEHCLQCIGFPENVKVGKGFSVTEDMQKLRKAIELAESLLEKLSADPCQGVIIQKKEKRAAVKEGEPSELLTYEEFHPMLFKQFENKPFCMFETFNKSVDEFFSQIESQKLDMKALQQEKSALKKLENIKKDHEKRIEGLQKEQGADINKGRLIELNLPLVDQALLIVRSAIANQIDWTEIESLVHEAQLQGDPVASCITGLKLDSNTITLLLRDPYRYSDDEYDDEDDDDILKPTKVDIDISMSAYGNSRKYFEKKKTAAKKEQKTIDASAKALKSAEKKTKETLKEVATAATINKARKTYWFEKFLWFITSENYLVIGGRDQQQNEMIVKRYLRPGDLYIHADLHGASSCVLKNPSGEPVPPKSLNEAGTMAICNSVAWDAKVVTSAWWVYHDQVSKTAPAGEYLTTGSFMIRGKKNYLPPTHLVYGFGLLFKLEEESIERHRGERKVHGVEDDSMSVTDSIATESDLTTDTNSVTMDTDSNSDSDSEDDNRSENSKESDRHQEGESRICENTSESRTEGSDGGGNEDKAADKEEGEEEEEEASFPDTSISLQHVQGDKFELQRERSSTSGSMEEPQKKETEPDGKTGGRGAKLSAKQRREMRKAKKSQSQQANSKEDEEDQVSWLHQDKVRTPSKDLKEDQSTPIQEDPCEEEGVEKQPQIQLKRGQRNRLKKMKEKYGDQDEEERQLRMEILASAGSKKEDKKKKGKKGQNQSQQQKSDRPVSAKQQLQQQKAKGQAKSVDMILKPTAEIIIDDSTIEDREITPVLTVKQEAQNESDDEKQEEDVKPDDVMMLDSLTGCPVVEDELLYAIPVCAPYSTMLNYKFKVKLMPGSTKRGKAAKLALNMFSHEKSTTPRERDLIRILKDADTSRNIPGKVKVSAPNLHRVKGK